MNKIGLLLGELHEAQTELAEEFRAVAGRESVEHDVYYMCHTLAEQADGQAERVRAFAEAFGATLSSPSSSAGGGLMEKLRHKAAEVAGRRPASGLLLLRDLRRLYMLAEGVNIHWIMLGQVAQAVRDHDLLSEVSSLHKQTLTQIKWLKTKIKESAPQTLVAGQPEAMSESA